MKRVCCLVILLPVLFLFGCGTSKEDEVINLIKQGDYSKAYELYEENIQFNDEKELKFSSNYIKYLNESKELFHDNEISFDEIMKIIDVSKKFDDKEINKISEELKTYVNALKESRTSFITAESYFEKNDYENAVIYYDAVIEEDINYENAVNKRKEAIEQYHLLILQEADKYIDIQKYDQAINILQQSLNILREDTEIQSKLIMCREKELEVKVGKCIESATEYYTSGNYDGALSVLTEGMKLYKDESLKEKYSEIYDDYLELVIEEAKEKFNKEGHTAAISTLNSYYNTFKEDTKYNEQLTYYKNLEPDNLSDLEPFNTYLYMKDFGEQEDKLGNIFMNAYRFEGEDAGNYAEYYINSQYKSISGILAYGGDKSDSMYYAGIDIYVDDILIYQSPLIYAKTEPVEFKVDVTGAKYVKLVYKSYGNGYWNGWCDCGLILADARLNKY